MKAVRLGITVVAVLLALPLAAHAQDTTITGTVRDSSGGVLPGVTVTATHEAAGTTFVAVTDDRGLYRIPVRAGVYRITTELPGFTTIARPGVELLVGREVTLNLDMTVSGVQETVTVTEEAPLIETTSSTVNSNIDPRQMQELPVNGRNWMDLSMLAPGSRSNAATEVPQDRQGFFQVNVDGQQVTQLICCSQQQPRYSRDSIAEFEVISNRFDAAQGRSQGMVVNAITKSGTNRNAGTFSGYFRDDSLNSPDFIQNRVLPYADQQLSGTFGGPIRRDRVHFFANYEFEREPGTVTFNSPYPSFNVDLAGTRRQHTAGVRGDVQFAPGSHLQVRYSKYNQLLPNQNTGGAALHPSSSQNIRRQSDQVWGQHSWVLTNRAVNQLKAGVSNFHWALLPNTKWQGGPFPNAKGMEGGSPNISFSGYTIGTPTNSPQDIYEFLPSIRDDFTVSFSQWGRHDVKTGGEYLYWYGGWNHWCNRCSGVYRINARPPANVESLFPVYNDASTWNLGPLSPLVVNYEESVGDHSMSRRRDVFAAWFQDDWAMTNRLTLNLGVRYDLDLGVLGEDIEFLPFLSGNRPHDRNNVAPRLGFAYALNDRTVIRGGYGLFFTQLESDAAHQSELWTKTAIPQVLNDGRADFATNPFNGPKPTYEQVLANACDVTGNRAGCLRRSVTIEIPAPSESSLAEPLHEVSFSHQASVGVQRQIGSVMAFETNYVFTGGRKEEVARNMNLSYNAATGANYPFTDRTRLPFPDWGLVLGEFMVGRTNYHGLESSFTKRMNNRWQASASYSISRFKDSPGNPVFVSPDGTGVNWVPLGFAVAPDLGDDYGLAVTDQHHRATFNGIWDMGLGFQLSGLYFFGSGQRFTTNWGADLRSLGTTADQSQWGQGRLRPDGTIVPRNDLVGEPIHRTDMRLQKRFRLAGTMTADGMIEVFNVFNHVNYGSYTTSQSNPQYGLPSFNANVAYQPRIVQLGFRFAF